MALLMLKGLPDAAREQASSSAVEQMRGDIKVGEETASISGEVNIKIVKISAGINAKIVEFADGSVHISIEQERGIGVGIPDGAPVSGDAMLNLKGELVLSFDSRAEANQFLIDLAKSPLPNELSDIARLGFPPEYVRDQITDFLDRHGHHYETTVFTGEVSGEVGVKVPGLGEVKLDSANGVSYDTSAREATFYMERSVEGTSFGPFSMTGSAEARFELVVGGDGLEKLVIHTAASGGAGITDYSGAIEGHTSLGGSMTIEIDVTNPRNQGAVGDLMRAVAGGDRSGLSAALSDLYSGSKVTIQQNEIVSSSIGVDAKIGSVSGSVGGTSATSTVVKPPFGTPQKVR